jgi:hypothetical protein
MGAAMDIRNQFKDAFEKIYPREKGQCLFVGLFRISEKEDRAEQSFVEHLFPYSMKPLRFK